MVIVHLAAAPRPKNFYAPSVRKATDAPEIDHQIVISGRDTEIYNECAKGGGPLTACKSMVRRMNSFVAHLLAAVLADAADQLSGTPPSAQIPVADRTVSCCGGAEAGGR